MVSTLLSRRLELPTAAMALERALTFLLRRARFPAAPWD